MYLRVIAVEFSESEHLLYERGAVAGDPRSAMEPLGDARAILVTRDQDLGPTCERGGEYPDLIRVAQRACSGHGSVP